MAIKITGNTVINDARCLVNYGIVHNPLGSISGSQTLSVNTANYFSATITGSTTLTFSNPISSPNTCGFVLELTNGGAHSVQWPVAVNWPSGTAPTLTESGTDVLTFITDDAGTTWRGVLSMADSKAS
jgi:hypothetical protein